VNTVGSAAGKIGNGRDFESSNGNEHLTIANNASIQVGDINFHLSAWVKKESDGVFAPTIFQKGDTGGNEQFWLVDDTTRVVFFASNNGTSGTAVNGTSFGALSTGVFYFVESWHSATANEIGVRVNTVSNTASHSTGVAVKTVPLNIGWNRVAGSGAWIWDGVIDEARLSKALRSADWAKFEYRNIVESDHELGFGSEQEYTTSFTATAGIGESSGAGLALSVAAGFVNGCGLGDSSGEGQSADCGAGAGFAPGIGEASGSGFNPDQTRGQVLQPGIVSGTGEGFSPLLQSGLDGLTAGLGEGSGEGLQATVQAGQTVTLTAGIGDAAGEGLTATLAAGSSLVASLGDGSGAGLSPTLAVGIALQAGVAGATGEGLAASITAGGSFTGSAGIGDASGTGLGSSVVLGFVLGCGLDDGAGSGLLGSIAHGCIHTPGPGEGSGAGLPVVLDSGPIFRPWWVTNYNVLLN
jgi:hypothetical protein